MHTTISLILSNLLHSSSLIHHILHQTHYFTPIFIPIFQYPLKPFPSLPSIIGSAMHSPHICFPFSMNLSRHPNVLPLISLSLILITHNSSHMNSPLCRTHYHIHLSIFLTNHAFLLDPPSIQPTNSLLSTPCKHTSSATHLSSCMHGHFSCLFLSLPVFTLPIPTTCLCLHPSFHHLIHSNPLSKSHVHGQVRFRTCSTRRRCMTIQEGKRDNGWFKNREI